jgi:hypothetical protein
MNPIFDTGASTPEVNDLILFVENSSNLSELVELTYMKERQQKAARRSRRVLMERLLVEFIRVFYTAVRQYEIEVGEAPKFSAFQIAEFAAIYADQYELFEN